MIQEPGAATASENSNGWFILRDDEVKDEPFWSPPMSKKWAEKTSTTETPTQINEAMYGSDPTTIHGEDGSSDYDMGYLFADDDDSPMEVDHNHCDVDTLTGRLLRPLRHPRTFPARIHDLEPFGTDRKNRSSEDVIMQALTRKSKGTRKSTPQKAYQDALLALEEELREPAMSPEIGHIYSVPPSYTFRPASAADTYAITRIYNIEVRGAGMTPDSKPVRANVYQQILQACKANMKPFIVAVKRGDELADPSQWPNKKAHEDWLRLKRAQGEDIGKEEVVGFAYLCAFDYGVWSSEGNAQYSAKVRCFVDPDHRRSGVGRALVDLMLQMTVTGYKAKCDSVWQCQNPSKVFDRIAFNNTKKYHRIFIEVYFKNKGDPVFKGLRTLLENEFGFTLMGHILGAYMTARGEESEWLDKYIWGMDCVHQDEVGWYANGIRERRVLQED
ncbi:uncharacterized protein DNG_03853 [Cephalotrichum gorgonifer]|uniref:N-acetyltransferase domain-containing protein n=1 Tax=Cephalotrichum gorgonifer TaxID=2041049 RepID=A0AAE8MUW5_9PEZI|nr:uncharacterized protein DNG_03853 [Cephalotrichum gorgonifer]